jgi:hypothetical protein
LAPQLRSASAALTSFGVRGKPLLSTGILGGAARTIPPPIGRPLTHVCKIHRPVFGARGSARLGYARQIAAKTKCKIRRFVFSGQPKLRGFVQACQCLTRCCLTLHSRGRPNGMSHWPSSAGACAPFCACCPARHAAGLPLNSNVRQHTKP